VVEADAEVSSVAGDRHEEHERDDEGKAERDSSHGGHRRRVGEPCSDAAATRALRMGGHVPALG
jgi:hypothetical protein